MRTLSLADFNREVGAVGGKVTTVDSADDETGESAENGFEISPELMYTTEHEMPTLREHIVMEPKSAEPAATANGDDAGTRAGDRDDSGAKRRRGRRGGRRGRGGEQNER
jgi:hypothetical protein